MNSRKIISQKRMRRIGRTRSKISGTAERPRLAVFRSNRATYAQLINDETHRTLAHASSSELESADKNKTKTEEARRTGELLAERALKLGITKVVFDRRAYRYHGRVKVLAEAVRRGGLTV